MINRQHEVDQILLDMHNDLFDANFSKNSIKKKFYLITINYIEDLFTFHNLKEAIHIYVTQYKNYSSLTDEYRKQIIDIDKTSKLKLTEFDKYLKKILYFSDKNNIKIDFAYVPLCSRYFFSWSDHDIHNYKSILEIFKKNNVNLFDMHKEYMIELDDPLSAYAKGCNSHFSKKTYREIALKMKSEFLNK